jgi:hypothetical protein
MPAQKAPPTRELPAIDWSDPAIVGILAITDKSLAWAAISSWVSRSGLMQADRDVAKVEFWRRYRVAQKELKLERWRKAREAARATLRRMA